MKFSVIIPTYNDWTRLKQCLDALEKQTLSRDEFEIIVVNNNKECSAPTDFNPSGKVQMVHEPTPGSYVARNRGVEIAQGKILAFTDSDCIPVPDWLLNAEKAYKNPKTDLIGGGIKLFRTKEGNEIAYIYASHTAFPQHINVPLGKGVTANLFVKKSIFEALGGFDPTVKSGEDWEFTTRCTQMGYKMIYDESVLILHPASNDLASLFRKYYRLTCWAAINIKRKFGYSQLRILGSHLLKGLEYVNIHQSKELNSKERIIIFSIDLLRYLHRAVVHTGILLKIINPYNAR